MWEFSQGYGVWILLAIAAIDLVAGACGRGGGMGCGGHGAHGRYREGRRPSPRELMNERDEESVGASRNGGGLLP